MFRKLILTLTPCVALLAAACGDDDNKIASCFEDKTLEEDSHFTPDATGLHTWTSGQASYVLFTDNVGGMDYWEGITYSNETDTETAGVTNQFSAITGSDKDHHGIYAVVTTYAYNYPAEVTFPDGALALKGFWVTNTTFAYLSMRDGDDYAKKFGGEDGTDPDWFLLTIHGLDAEGRSLGTVEFYLADFRSDNAGDDFIRDKWTWVDLSNLGEVHGLRFDLTSSDTGDWGMNTPAYFAFDRIEY